MLNSCDCALELIIAQQYCLRSEDGLILYIISLLLSFRIVHLGSTLGVIYAFVPLYLRLMDNTLSLLILVILSVADI
jgi:hypothetical protein